MMVAKRQTFMEDGERVKMFCKRWDRRAKVGKKQSSETISGRNPDFCEG
jgi:hypothetical protein